MTPRIVGPGRPHPMGVTPLPEGEGDWNVVVFSAHATRVELCVLDGDRETRLPLPERTGDLWHARVSGIGPGTRYGLRAHGPWAPEDGHRFDPLKLLLDPYARRIDGAVRWDDALLERGVEGAPFVPRSVVTAPLPPAGGPPPLPVEGRVIYEAHLRALTMRMPGVERPGTWSALASEPVIEHLLSLGVAAVELLPVHAFIDDRFLVERGLRNHWGYQTIGFLAPEPRYLSDGDPLEVQRSIRRLRERGIAVLLDVVYNHSGEGDHRGPTLSFRGLDNASYYRLEADDRSLYVNDTGTGNTLDADHPAVQRLILDSLRHWAGTMGADGFRFDLCTVLGRTPAFDPGAALFDAMRQDPVIAARTLIAEPWDIGPGGYQLGAYPPPFLEWNDRFRDDARRFWRGDADTARALAERIAGSARQFDHSGRPATTSVNFVTAHDGFTLLDAVSYVSKHNEANGEGNRDGHDANHSSNLGVEGPTDDPAIRAARDRRRRNLLATVMLSQGTPMMLAGDELGHGQGGNNNAYAQDNETTWLDWERADAEFHGFVRRLVAFRRAHPILRQRRFLHSRDRVDGFDDLAWRRADGAEMTQADWADPTLRLVVVEQRIAAGTPDHAEREGALLLAFNGGEARDLSLPPAPGGRRWERHLDTAAPDAAPRAAAPVERVEGESVLAFVLVATQPVSRGENP